MSPVRIAVACAVILAAPGGLSAAPRENAGFVDSWRQFLELDEAHVTGHTGGKAGHRFSLRLQQMEDGMRGIFADARTYQSGFAGLEQSYDKLLTGYRAEVKAVLEDKAIKDQSIRAARMQQVVTRAGELLSQQHVRVTSVREGFRARFEIFSKDAASLIKACHKGAPSAEAKVACARFEDGYAATISKGDAVNEGFERAESVYLDTRDKFTQIGREATAGLPPP